MLREAARIANWWAKTIFKNLLVKIYGSEFEQKI